MGPSGCGKTTLLNVLARRRTNASRVQARMLVNGSELSDSAFRQMTCFVEQDDALIGSLTVRETLEFSARLSDKRFALTPLFFFLFFFLFFYMFFAARGERAFLC